MIERGGIFKNLEIHILNIVGNLTICFSYFVLQLADTMLEKAIGNDLKTGKKVSFFHTFLLKNTVGTISLVAGSLDRTN